MKKTPSAHASSPESSFESEVRAVIADLRHAVLAALGDQPDAAIRAPAELSRDLGLDTKLGWKLHWMLSNEDPFAAALFVPGRAGIGLIAEGLDRAGADRKSVDAVRKAGEAFHACVTRHADNRAGFDVLLSAQSTEERSTIEHRKLAFQGIRSVWGIECVANLMTYVLHPSASGDEIDVALLRGIIGCQRLRRDVPWRVARMTVRKTEGVESGFRREAVDPSLRGTDPGEEIPLLKAYCSDPPPAIERAPSTLGAVEYMLGPGPVGKRGRFDLVMGEVSRSLKSRYVEDGEDPLRTRFALRIPAQQAVFDVFMHRDLFSRARPRVSIVSDLFAGIAGPSVPVDDELPGPPELEVLRAHPTELAVEAFPRFADAVDEALGTLGWAPESFDVFRVRMPYPPVPTTLVMSFDSASAARRPR